MAQSKRLSALDLVQQRNQGASSRSDFLARNPISQTSSTPQTSSGFGDFGQALKTGALELPSVATGLADIGAGLAGFDRPVSRAADAVGDFTGLDFDTWAQEARQQYSPEGQSALQKVREADGFFGTVQAALENPRAIGIYAGEAIPGTIAGGGVAGAVVKGAGKKLAKQQAKRMGAGPVQPTKTPFLARPAVAGGIGEGAVAGGYAMSGTDESVDPRRAALGALASGAGVGLIGGVGASVARKLGVSDPDLLFVNGRPQPIKGVKRRNILKRVGLGAVAEGVFEELPQSAYEAVISNYVEGRNIFEGVGSDAAMGMLTGAAMGGAANIFGGRRNFEEPPPPAPPKAKGQETPDAPTDTKDKLVQELPEEDLYTLWARSLDAAENFAEDPETLEKIREYQAAMRSEFAKRGLSPQRVDEGVAYEGYKKLKDRVELTKQKVRSATAEGGSTLEQAQDALSTALAELNIAEGRNPDFVGRLEQETQDAAKQAYFDMIAKAQTLGKKVAKLPPRSFSIKDEAKKNELAAVKEQIAKIGAENPTWAQEANDILNEQVSAAQSAKEGATKTQEDAAVSAKERSEEFFDDQISEASDEDFLAQVPSFGETAVKETTDDNVAPDPADPSTPAEPAPAADPAVIAEPAAETDSVLETLDTQQKTAGARKGTKLINDFLAASENADDLAKAKKGASVTRSLATLEGKLDTLDEGGVRLALGNQEKARDKAKGKKTFASEDRKARFIKKYMAAKGYTEQSLATMAEAERQDPTEAQDLVGESAASTDVANVPRGTDMGFMTLQTRKPELTERAGEAVSSLTDNDLAEAMTRMQTILRVPKREVELFERFLEVINDDLRNPDYGSSTAMPWETLSQVLAEEGYTGTKNPKNIRKKVREITEKYREALKSVRTDIPEQVIDAIITRAQSVGDAPRPSASIQQKRLDKLQGAELAFEEERRTRLREIGWWVTAQGENDAEGAYSDNPFDTIRNFSPDPEARIVGVWKTLYAPLAEYLSKSDVSFLQSWAKKKRELRQLEDSIQATITSFTSVLEQRAGALDLPSLLAENPRVQETYEEARQRQDPTGEKSPTWEQLLQQPEAAVTFIAGTPGPAEIEALQEEADTVRTLLLEGSLEEAYEALGDSLSGTYGFDDLELQKNAYENNGVLDPEVVDPVLEGWVESQATIFRWAANNRFNSATDTYNNDAATEDVIERRVAESRKELADLQAVVAQGSARSSRILAKANKKALNARRAEIKARAQAQETLQTAQIFNNAVPFAALEQHPIYQGVRTYNQILAQRESEKVSPQSETLVGKVGPTLAAIARGDANPFTWAKASRQRGGYESTLSPNGLMWTIRKSPTDSSVQQLWLVKDSPIGEVNEATDELWQETNKDSGIKNRKDLREFARSEDASLSYSKVDIETVVAARANERSRSRVEAQNELADKLSGNDFSVLAALLPPDAPSTSGTVPIYIKEKSRRGEYGPVRPTIQLTKVYQTGAQVSKNGMDNRVQVIGDPTVMGADPVVNQLVDKYGMQTIAQDGEYKAKLYFVTVPIEQVGNFMAAEANQVIQDVGAAQIAIELQNLEFTPELDAAPALTGPVFNYAEKKLKNLAHIQAMLNSGATEIKFSAVVPFGQAGTFEGRLKEYTVTAAGQDLAPAKQKEAFERRLRSIRRKQNVKKEGPYTIYSSYNNVPVVTPSSVTEVRSVVEQVMPNAKNVTVVQSLADIADFAESRKLSLHPTTGGFVYQDRVYLIADNIEQSNVLGVLLHEAGVHTSMPKSMVNNYADQIREAAQAGDAIAQEAVDRAANAAYIAAGSGAQVDIVALNQETVAYFVEEAVNNFDVTPSQIGKAPSAIRKVLFKIMTYMRQALASLGIRTSKLTAQNLVDMAFGMANNTIRRPMGQQEFLMSATATQTAMGRAQRAWEQAGEPGRSRFKSLYDQMRAYRDRFLFGYSFGKMVSDVFPQMNTYNRLMRAGNAARGEVDADLQRLTAPFDKFKRGDQRKINDFLLRTQEAGAWVFDPVQAGIANPTKPETFDSESDIAKEFAALPSDQQALIKSVFKYASDLQQRLHDAYKTEVEVRYQSLMQDATAEDKLALLENMKKDLRAHDKTKVDRLPGWLPLRRHGKFAAVFMSNQMRALLEKRDQEGGNNKDTIEAIKKLRADKQHYEVRFSESRYDAYNAASTMATGKAEGSAETFTREEVVASGEVVPAYMYNALEANLRDVSVGNNRGESAQVTAKALRRAVTKMYIAGLADSNARKSELGRDLVAGADGNMMRGFLDYGQSVGTTIASLTTGQQTAQVLQEMRKESRKSSPNMDRQRKSDVYSEIIHRHTAAIDPDPTPAIDTTMGITSFWMLLSSPAYYMQNMTQPWLMTLPVMAGQFGMGASSSAIGRYYGVVNKAWSAAHEDMVGRLSRGDMSVLGGELADLEAIRDEIGEDAYNLLSDMKEQGVFDVGVSADFGNVYQSESDALLAKASNVFGRIHKKLVHGVRSVEVYNRGVTALAAFELAKKNPQKLPLTRVGGASRRMTPEEYAFDVVMGTQGDYSGANAPSVINRIPGGWGKVAFQFRKFQLIQIELFSGMVKRAFFGADPMEKAVARRQFGYLLGANMMVGGALALPAANIAGAAVAFAFGDEEEPDNFEMMMREYIGDPVLADVVLKGLPTLVDQDWSAKLGWGQTFSVLPYTKWDVNRDAPVILLATVLGGPTLAAASNIAGGIGLMLEGNTAAGMIETLPRGIRDAARALSLATRGMVDRSQYEKVMLSADEITGMQIFSQAIGAPSATQTRIFSVNRGVREAKQFFSDRSTSIQAAYVKARRARDNEAVKQAREDWYRLQAARVREGFPRQDISVLTNSVQQVQEAERNTKSGVPFDRSTRRYVERRI